MNEIDIITALLAATVIILGLYLIAFTRKKTRELEKIHAEQNERMSQREADLAKRLAERRAETSSARAPIEAELRERWQKDEEIYAGAPPRMDRETAKIKVDSLRVQELERRANQHVPASVQTRSTDTPRRRFADQIRGEQDHAPLATSMHAQNQAASHYTPPPVIRSRRDDDDDCRPSGISWPAARECSSDPEPTDN